MSLSPLPRPRRRGPTNRLLALALAQALLASVPALAADAAATDALATDVAPNDGATALDATGTATAADVATDTAPPATLQAVTVTGSNIARSDSEGTHPVQVITAEEISRSGKATVSDLLRSISANTGYSWNENRTASWTPGAAGIGLRGLSQKNTLILLNGRRLANYSFPQQALSDVFVNLNALPLSALARVEVLKDGASAVYGSDAVAGVINLITLEDYEGFQIGGSTGAATEGGAEQAKLNLSGGKGNLERDGYNVFFSIDAFHREPLMQDERDLTRSGDFTGQPGGGLNGWAANGARFIVNGASVPLLDGNGNCPTGMVLRDSAPIDGRSGQTCAYSLVQDSMLVPDADRFQIFSRGTFKLGDSTELFAEALYSRTKGRMVNYVPYFTLEANRFALNPNTGLAETLSNLLPASSPYNPYGTPVALEYTFFDLGRAERHTDSKFHRVLAGVRGDWNQWRWEASAFQSGSNESDDASGGLANRYTLYPALADGSYNLLNPSLTPRSVIDAIRLTSTKRGKSTLAGADLRAARSLFDLPAGTVNFAGGIEWRKEELRSSIPVEISNGSQIRPSTQFIDGKRQVAAAYAEFNVPVTSTLELEFAARGDHYDDFGSAFSPRYSFRWQPFDALLLRGAFSRGFRAPHLGEAGNSSSIGTATVRDPYDPITPNAAIRPTVFTYGSEDLKPERVKSYNLGTVYALDSNTSISLDYYKIELSNLIGRDDPTAVVTANNSSDVVRDANGRLVAIYNRTKNLTELKTSGFDVQLSRRFATESAGQFNVSSALTYVRDYRRQNVAGGPLVDYAGTNGYQTALPDLKATTQLDWNYNDWNTSLTWYHTAGYDQKQITPGVNGVASKVDAYNQFDLYLGYRGFDRLTLYAKVANIANKLPPYDPSGYTSSAVSQRAPYEVAHYDLIGRYITVGFNYTF